MGKKYLTYDCLTESGLSYAFLQNFLTPKYELFQYLLLIAKASVKLDVLILWKN